MKATCCHQIRIHNNFPINVFEFFFLSFFFLNKCLSNTISIFWNDYLIITNWGPLMTTLAGSFFWFLGTIIQGLALVWHMQNDRIHKRLSNERSSQSILQREHMWYFPIIYATFLLLHSSIGSHLCNFPWPVGTLSKFLMILIQHILELYKT